MSFLKPSILSFRIVIGRTLSCMLFLFVPRCVYTMYYIKARLFLPEANYDANLQLYKKLECSINTESFEHYCFDHK